jgi:protein involved in polysaccharide export with SLBB domain
MKAMLLAKVKAVAAVLVLVVGIGLGAAAVTWQCGPAAWGAAPPQAAAGGKTPAAPARKDKAYPPGYVIASPDILQVQFTPADGARPAQITGQHLVRPDGMIGLGPLGSVFVSGLTPQEAHGAIAAHLGLDDLDRKRLTVEVAVINSRVYYVIAEGDDGTERVYRFPATRSDTVLDAVVRAKVALHKLSQKRIAVHRVSGYGKPGQVLPVDWKAITHDGNTATNYQLQPGDRLRIRNRVAKKPLGASRTEAAKVGHADAVQELEALTKALRAARSPEELQRVVEDLDGLTRSLRERLKKPGGAGGR